MTKQVFKLLVFVAACLFGMLACKIERSRFVAENNYENLDEYIVRKLVEE